jgi:hypothetical protein
LRQKPRAVGVGIAPDRAAHRQKAVRLAVREGRVGEQRVGDRLERERTLSFFTMSASDA